MGKEVKKLTGWLTAPIWLPAMLLAAVTIFVVNWMGEWCDE